MPVNFPTALANDSSMKVAKNFVATTLRASMDATQTTIPVTSATRFPNPAGATYFVTIEAADSTKREVCSYTGVDLTGGAHALTGVTRGVDADFPGQAHGSGVSVQYGITKDYHESLKGEILAVQTKVGVDGSATTTTHDYKLNEVTGSDKSVGKTATQTLTNKTLTSPTINTPAITGGTHSGGTHTAITTFSLRNAGTGAFDVTFIINETLAAGRNLTFTLNDAARTINLGGNLTLAGALTTSGAFGVTFTATGTTTVTLPTTGTLTTLAGTETFTNKTLTAPTINGGTHTALTALGIRSTGTGAFDLTLANTENLTAGRTLTITVNDVARTINLAGNLTLAAAFITSGANSLTLTTTGITNVTLPTTGTLATLAGSETFTNKVLTSPTINTPSINTPTITAGTATALTGLAIRSSGSAFDLTFAATEVFTAGRTLTFIVNNVARTINIAGNITTAAAFTTSGANALTLTTTASTNVTLPTTGTLATLAGSETLTNKTLTSPSMTTPTIASGDFLINGSGKATFNRQYASTRFPVTFSATPTFDWNNSNFQSMTLTGNITTMTLSNPIDGGRYVLLFTQDATGGRTIAWPASVKWPGGTAPVLSAASKSDKVNLDWNGTNYFATIVGEF